MPAFIVLTSTMVSYVFYLYGNICTSFPWEVIVSTISLTVYILTVDFGSAEAIFNKNSYLCCRQDHSLPDMMIMTIIKCLALFYSYCQFRNLRAFGSKYVLGVTGLFMIFSSFLFIMMVLNFLQIDLRDLQDAIFFFLLLIDLSKAARLARFALSSSSEIEIKSNIAKGLSVLGPKITLDTAVEILVIGIGTLSGVPRLEILCYFACLSVIINYVVFMTFYPSSLFLLVDLSKNNDIKKRDFLPSLSVSENSEKCNPIVERVKLIMTICLLLIHLIIRRSVHKNYNILITSRALIPNYVATEGTNLNWLSLRSDYVVILVLLLALFLKYLYSESVVVSKCTEKKTKINKSIGVQVNSSDISTQTRLKIEMKPLSECLEIYKKASNASSLTDDEIIQLVMDKYISTHHLENAVKNSDRAVKIRRHILSRQVKYKNVISLLPSENFDYDKVFGVCCENVIGYIPVPLGIAGPLKIDDCLYDIPMATTEGCLIASITRGCKAVSINGVCSKIVNDGMTRGPVVRFPTAVRATTAMEWLQDSKNFEKLKQAFDSTSRYARLTRLKMCIAGRYLFIRFIAKTGDAMGMNMLSKGAEESLKFMQKFCTDMEILSLSGNFCTDKKSAYINWIDGRGKSVICEAVVPSAVVTSVLKTSVHAIVDLNISKNLIGASVVGSIGGNNAHAANVVTAIFIATGQDPAQNVVSSNCMTLIEPWGPTNEDLYISCTMPSLEVGTVGGGTVLPAQSACLDMLGIKGGNVNQPGENANQLARIICATVLAGELSLLASLSAGHLVQSHLKYNRSTSATI